MKTISDADWEIIKSAAQVAIDGTLSRSKHKEWSDAMARVETESFTPVTLDNNIWGGTVISDERRMEALDLSAHDMHGAYLGSYIARAIRK